MKRITRKTSAFYNWRCEVTDEFPNAKQVRLVVPPGEKAPDSGLERWWFMNEDLEDA